MARIAGIDHVQVAIPPGADDAARAFYGGVLGSAAGAAPGSRIRSATASN